VAYMAVLPEWRVAWSMERTVGSAGRRRERVATSRKAAVGRVTREPSPGMPSVRVGCSSSRPAAVRAGLAALQAGAPATAQRATNGAAGRRGAGGYPGLGPAIRIRGAPAGCVGAASWACAGLVVLVLSPHRKAQSSAVWLAARMMWAAQRRVCGGYRSGDSARPFCCRGRPACAQRALSDPQRCGLSTSLQYRPAAPSRR
jgi:hypothetical protein